MPVLFLLGSESPSVESAMTTAFTNIASQIQSTATSVAPIALGVVGIGIVIGFGIKLYKRITNKG